MITQNWLVLVIIVRSRRRHHCQYWLEHCYGLIRLRHAGLYATCVLSEGISRAHQWLIYIIPYSVFLCIYGSDALKTKSKYVKLITIYWAQCVKSPQGQRYTLERIERMLNNAITICASSSYSSSSSSSPRNNLLPLYFHLFQSALFYYIANTLRDEIVCGVS